MECRSHCGACCIAPSINFSYYGMPEGKPANVACTHLNLETMVCGIWGTEYYPSTCKDFHPEIQVCGSDRGEALKLIACLEIDTDPNNTLV